MQLYHTGHILHVSAQHSGHEAAVSELEGHPQLHGEATQKMIGLFSRWILEEERHFIPQMNQDIKLY